MTSYTALSVMVIFWVCTHGHNHAPMTLDELRASDIDSYADSQFYNQESLLWPEDFRPPMQTRSEEEENNNFEERFEPESSTPYESSISTTPMPIMGEHIRHMQNMRQQLRRQRVRNLQQDILRRLGLRNPPAVSPQSRQLILNRLTNNHYDLPMPTAAVPEYRSCHLGSCSTPPGTNETLWTNSSQPAMRLYFPLPRLNRRDREKTVKTAKLKLFVAPKKDCPCILDGDDALPRLLVTVYQFVRPLSVRKRNRVVYRRRLLDAEMVPSQGNLWVTLNVKHAVTSWMARPRRNFGLEITVKDVNEIVVDVSELFVWPQCTEGNERTCRDDNGETIEEMPWLPTRTRDFFVSQNTPYLDIVVTDREEDRELFLH